MKLGKIAVLTACVAVVGCGSQAGSGSSVDETYGNATPSMDAAALEISGAASEDSTDSVMAQPTDVMVHSAASAEGTAPAYLLQARADVAALNAGLKAALTPVKEALENAAKTLTVGGVAVYGPRDEGTVTFELQVKKVADGKFGWKLEAKPQGAEDSAYVNVAAGGVAVGDAPHLGKGALGIDLDKLKSVDASFPGAGKLLVGYSASAVGRTLAYRLQGFTSDASSYGPVTAAFVGHRALPSMQSAVRAVGYADFPGTATGAKELIQSRVRWIPGVGGRADVRATQGDLPSDQMMVAVSCWDRAESETYTRVFQCNVGDLASCVQTEGSAKGTISQCAQSLQDDAPEPPSADVNDTTPETGAPDMTLDAPTDFPVGF